MRPRWSDESDRSETPARAEFLGVLAGCAAASLAAIAWSWRHAALLNYGDAIAHLHIARRIVDSRRPGLEQFGSVWLPLPHLLMLPFVQVYAWWADGLAGTIPSALAYVAACAGLYRLARRWLKPSESALALSFFALNPNLLYLQTTAMTEPLFLCEMIWIVVGLVEWRASLDSDPPRAERLQGWIAVGLVAAVFTRYDGWVMALLAWGGIGVALFKRGRLRSRSFWIGSIGVAAAPAAWLVYNSVVFGDWLEFARGPYSAKAIELRTAHGAGPPHPGWRNPWVGLLFFLKVSEMDSVALAWENLVLALTLLGAAWSWIVAWRKSLSWTLLLWLPVPFYAYSVAYGSVPIFIPPWWPHSFYNTRYGMELLPAFALGLGFAAALALALVRQFKPAWVRYAVAALAVLVALNACALLRGRPLVFVEGTKNLAARQPFDEAIPPLLRRLAAARPGGAVLMITSVHPELVALSGIPLRRTICESDKQFYRAALADPSAHAAIVLAFAGDEIDRAVELHPEGLRAVARFTASGQPAATMYLSDLERQTR